MPEQRRTYLVALTILEGRHYAWPNMDSVVVMQVGKQKKSTSVKKCSDSPFYNEYFVFELNATFERLLSRNVTLQVIKPGGFMKKQKILGYTTFDVATVWYEPEHMFYHKWAILNAPSEDLISGNRGYLKIDISILSKGEIPRTPTAPDTDEIEGNLLLPEGITAERQRVVFNFDIYRGENFVKNSLTSKEYGNKGFDNPPSTQIEISFAGVRVKSSMVKQDSSPVWNERLGLAELFPPLCQRFTIELHQGAHKKSLIAVKYLYLKDIASEKQEGFLPTFGPDYVHFYSKDHLEGYQGSIILHLETEIFSNVLEIETHKTVVNPMQPAPRMDESVSMRPMEEVILFAAVFDVSVIEQAFAEKRISFRLACGSLAKNFGGGDATGVFFTPPLKPKIINNGLYHLPIKGDKPCMHMVLNLPDKRRRMYHYNLLKNFSLKLREKIEQVESICTRNYYTENQAEMEELLMESLDFALTNCQKYLDIASAYERVNITKLDEEIIRRSLEEMEKIKETFNTLYKNLKQGKMFRKLEKICMKIETLVQELEDWPMIYLWMLSSNKRVAYYRIEPKSVLYSKVQEECGMNCGILQTIYFQIPGEDDSQGEAKFISMACKMELILWMGISRHWEDFMSYQLPQGFTPSPEPIPSTLQANQQYDFTCRAHIFQARFTPGADKSGYCDPYMNIILTDQFRQTEHLKKTLSPVWDQTLIFQKVTLYGSKRFIVENPPIIFIAIYDVDICHAGERAGRSTVRPIVEIAGEDHSEVKLYWYQIFNRFDVSAEFLGAFELVELTGEPEPQPKGKAKIMRIPPEIKPNLVTYRIEVLFWGMRNLKKMHLRNINRPKIVVECINTTMSSDTLANASKNLNFTNSNKKLDVTLSEQEEYAPPLTLKMFDCRNFGLDVFAGIHVVPIHPYLYYPTTESERTRKLMEGRILCFYDIISVDSIISNLKLELSSDGRLRSGLIEEGQKPRKLEKVKEIFRNVFKKPSWCGKCPRSKKPENDQNLLDELPEPFEDIEDFDWWTKFYASVEPTPAFPEGKIPAQFKRKLVVYPSELEQQPQFSNLCDTLESFAMYKGKRTGDEAVDEINTVGIFKGAIKVYRWPPQNPDTITISGEPIEEGVFQDFPVNTPVRFKVRVYCIRAINIRPMDFNGKSDSYLVIQLNKKIIDDKENRIMNNVCPVYGRCFELTGIFPEDHTLKISVYDWDAATANDLIGETEIDLESRFYSKHRPYCGIAETYEESGYCEWRDQQKPVSILEGLCRKYNLEEPEFGAASVKVAYNEFRVDNFTPSGDLELDREVLAIAALRRWKEIPVVGFELVPEHIETRSLYNPHKPGIEQGKIQMWIDILPYTDVPAPPQVDIKPREATEYELRVIIWNVDQIKATEDDFFTGEQKSDIFVKGWILNSDQAQVTDVHYRSISGEGNFNWRFVFKFAYLTAEGKISYKQKTRFFSLAETEYKIPCKLTLQVWDNDTFSANDFLGTVSLELSKLPRGAKNSEQCTVNILDPKAPTVNLFKIRRSRGWWPFVNKDENGEILFAGAVDAELELMSLAEAKECPAGLGRDEPQALPPPKRPDTSFAWFKHPLKAFFYMAKRHKWSIFRFFAIIILLSALVVFYYSLPILTAKKLLDVV